MLVLRYLRNFIEASFLTLAVQIFVTDGAGCGDRPEDFLYLRYSLGIAPIMALIMSYLENKNAEWGTKIHYWVWWFVRYYLGYVLIGYGVAKVIDMQFHGSLAQLDTKVGDLSPMGMVWQFFGYSYGYNFFIGCSQIIASLLLFNRRTATFAACFMFAILSNIVLVNYFYEVCVKLFSTIYLAMNLYLLACDAPRLWAFFFGNQTITPQIYPRLWPERVSGKTVFWANVVVGVLMVGHQINLIAGYQGSDSTQTPPLYGAWNIEKVQLGDVIDEVKTDSVKWRRMFFEEGNWASINSETGWVAGFSTQYDTLQQTVELKSNQDTNQVWRGRYILNADKSRMTFRGLNGQDSVIISMRKIVNFKRLH